MSLKIRLIATDLDHTMLYQKNEVTERNYNAVVRARKKGCIYVAATGRCEAIVPGASLPPLDYTITCNGAVIIRQSDGNRLYTNYIPVENAEMALSVIRKYNPFLELFIDTNVMLEKNTAEHLECFWIPEFHRLYFESGKHLVTPSFEEYLEKGGERISKINLPCSEFGKLSALRQDLEQLNLFCVSSDGHGIELTNKGVDKGNALKLLCDMLHIKTEEAAVFGDGANDVSMLRIAGYGVAMENAVKEAREAASFHTLHYRQDGVAYFLEKEFGI